MFEGLLCILQVDSLLFPVYVYTFSKLVFKLTNDNSLPKIILFTILRVVFTLIGIPICLLVILILAITSDIMRLITKIYFGNKYVDFANGGDAMYSGDTRLGRGIIPALYYIEEKSPKTPELLMEHAKQTSAKVQANHPRLQCVLKRFLGYVHFIKSEDTNLNFINYFDQYNSDEEFQDILNKKITSALPINNTFLWDITIGKKSVIIQGKKCIPMLFRLHHSIGDGVALMTLMITNYADNGCDTILKLCDDLKKLGAKTHILKKKKEEHKAKSSVFDDFVKVVFKFINWLWNIDLYFGFDMIRGGEVENSWHDKPSGEINLKMLGLEDNQQIVQRIKLIKNKLKVSFNDVILGVIAASFTKYFVKNNKVCPEKIVTLNPYNLNANNFNDLLHFNAKNEPVTNLGNKFVIALISIPIKEEYLKNPKMFITEQHKITNYLKHSVDFQFMYWLVQKLVTITPIPIFVLLNKMFGPSTLVTNLPPLTAIRLIDHEIVDMTLSSVHNYNVATSISIYSYKNIFHITTMIDNKVISAVQQETVGNNMIQFINDIYESL